MTPKHALPGRRVGFSFPDGSKQYYDVDADGVVYWLQQRLDNKLQRRRVFDAELAERIRAAATEAADKA